MFKNLSLILCVCCLLLIIKYGLKKNPTQIARQSFLKMIGYFGNLNLKTHEKNIQKSKLTNKNTFAKSSNYKLVATMLFDLALVDVTVEGFLMGILFVSTAINLIIFMYVKSVLMFCMGLPAIGLFLGVLAYMMSNRGHYNKEFALMAAEDLMITSLYEGILKAIKDNCQLFDESVKPYFEAFISDIDEYRLPVDEALDNLTAKLGDSFFAFSEKVKEFEKTGKQGTLDTFKDDLALNVMRRTEMMELEEVLSTNNRTYLQTLSMTAGTFFALCSGTPKILELAVGNSIGRLILMTVMIIILYGFTSLQRLRN